MSKYRAVSLFSGIGGFDLGFHNQDFKTEIAVEIDKKIAGDYYYNFSDTEVINDDISKVNLNISDVDVVIGGSPCQGFSIIGKQQIDDPRNRLIWEYLRIVDQLRPKYFVFENSPNLISERFKRDYYDLFIQRAKNLGYTCKTSVLDAYMFGVPQHRRRLIIVAYRHDQLPPMFPKFATQRYHVWDAIGDLPNLSSIPELRQKHFAYVDYLSTGYSEWVNGYRMPKKRMITCARIINTTPQRLETYSKIPIGGRADFGHDQRLDPTQPSPSLTTKRNFIHPFENRCLVVREMTRLQSFPDWFQFSDNSITTGYIEVGNAVAPKMAEAIAETIKTALELR